MTDVDPADFPSRFRMALSQIGRDSIEPQWPSASWLSVVRRAIVLTAVFAAGLLAGDLSTAIFAAFGALQMGLLEAALTRTALARLLIVNIVALTLTVYIAASLGGTWWTVPLLGFIALVQGSNVASGLLPMSTSLGALIICVIFAGLPDAAAVAPTAAAWFAAGASLQSVVWLLTATAERARTVRRILANNIRSVQRLLRGGAVNGWQSHTASLNSQATSRVLTGSGLPENVRAAAEEVVIATSALHRSVVAWRVLKDPGWADRLRIDEALHRLVQVLDESLGRRRKVDFDRPQFASRTWACDTALEESLGQLQQAVSDLLAGTGPADRRAVETSPTPAGQSLLAALRVTVRAVRPSNKLFRHGVRLALAVMIAQTLALQLEVGHSFWIPLTVIFVVKPDWSFTLVRSTSRFVGNLGAVILIPLVLAAAGGANWAVIATLLAISLVAFRYFTGNYTAASFGIAGTILILDQVLSPSDSLYRWRIVATLIGTAIGLLVAIAVPSWSSRGIAEEVATLAAGLDTWSRSVFTGLLQPAQVAATELRKQGGELRSQLLDLVPRAAATLAEPWPKRDPRLVSAAVEAAQRMHLILTALAFHSTQLHAHDRPGLPVSPAASHVALALDGACSALGSAPPPSWVAPEVAPRVGAEEGQREAPGCGQYPMTAEDTAVVAQTTHVAQAADDFLSAVTYLDTPIAPRATPTAGIGPHDV
ncbi:MAG: hypothetical protein QG671_3550 [Actinomycetota bacterium]|nr:hypothetical protein [Actinomycetota bacterium]